MRTIAFFLTLLLPSMLWASPATARAKAIIAVLDADEDTYQPELPNDFDNSGTAASAPKSPEDSIADAVAAKLAGPLDAQNANLERLTEVLDKLSGKVAVLATPAPPKPETALPDTGQVQPPAVSVVKVWGKAGCTACDNAKADTRGYTALNFHFEKDSSKWPEWVKQKYAAGEELPLIEWKSSRPNGSYQAGWSGLSAFIKRYNASLKQAAVGAITMAPSSAGNSPTVARSHYPLLYGPGISTYDWPGDLRFHVTQSPHNLSPSSVARMTDRQLIQWHDSWHISHAGQRAEASPRRMRSRGISYSLVCPGRA